MVLYVVPIPAPPAGQDWTATVPGQYIYDVTAITAQLTLGAGTPTVCTDSSGSGHDLTYEPGQVAFGIPGYVTVDDMVQQLGGPSHFVATGTFNDSFLVANDLFFACWTDARISGGTGPAMIDVRDTGNGHIFFDLVADGSGGLILHLEWFNDDSTFGGADSPPGIAYGPHFFAVRYDLALDKLQFYVDGAPYGGLITNSGNPPGINDPNLTVAIGGQPGTFLPHYDEVAFGGNATTDFTWSNLYSLRGNFASYSANQLAAGPTGYYHLDDGAITPGRQVVLDVTDGTHKVLEVPTGFAESASNGPYAYTWQPNLNSSTETPDGLLSTVAIPSLILPAGYTVGTRTLDLAAGDQWSNINIWWSSDVMDAINFKDNYQYPPGVRLVYKKAGTP